MNKMVPFVIFVLFYLAISNGRILGPHDNVYCQPRPAVVAVDPEHHNFFPIYVELYRCQGSVSNSQAASLKCAPSNFTNVQVKNLFSRNIITLKNHTKCGRKCAKSSCDPSSFQHFNNSTCKCECKYKNGPPTPCGHEFEWKAHECRCKCKKVPDICPGGKVWSQDQCSCVCNESVASQRCKKNKILDQRTCQCVVLSATVKHGRQGNDKAHVFVTLLVLEAVVIAILVAALIHWVRKKRPVEEKMSNTKASSQDSTKPLTLRSDDNGSILSYGADSGT